MQKAAVIVWRCPEGLARPMRETHSCAFSMQHELYKRSFSSPAHAIMFSVCLYRNKPGCSSQGSEDCARWHTVPAATDIPQMEAASCCERLWYNMLESTRSNSHGPCSTADLQHTDGVISSKTNDPWPYVCSGRQIGCNYYCW
jgi:hypothetical protein